MQTANVELQDLKVSLRDATYRCMLLFCLFQHSDPESLSKAIKQNAQRMFSFTS
jgi:hypothetical protein